MRHTAEPAGAGVLRLHLGESSWGASPKALAALSDEVSGVSLYPDPHRSALIEALADHWGLTREHLCVGNGSDELVLMSALALGDVGRAGVTTNATFPGYATCLALARRGSVEVPAVSPAGVLDVSPLLAALPTAGVVFVCNPHNPTGSDLPPEQLDELVWAAARHDVPLVVDEAYMEFAPASIAASEYAASGAPVVALRTFSKAYGLAACRVGYAVGAPRLIARLREAALSVPFSVNRFAQAAAVAALRDQDHLATVQARTAASRSALSAMLGQRGRAHLRSVTNFVTVAVSDATAVTSALARDHRILVRDASLFGLDGHVRVTLGREHEVEAFVRALDEVLDATAHGIGTAGRPTAAPETS